MSLQVTKVRRIFTITQCARYYYLIGYVNKFNEQNLMNFSKNMVLFLLTYKI